MKEKTFEELVAQDKAVWDNTPTGEWLDASFSDNESGEFFFVELRKASGEDMEDFIARCAEIAADNFDDPCYVRLYDSGCAEALGYDTY